MTRTANDYVFKPARSQNWYVRFEKPDGKRTSISLGTPDRLAAEVVANAKGYIAKHKARLLAKRPQFVAKPFTMQPGSEYTNAETGERVVADAHVITHLTADGKFIRNEPNLPSRELINLPMGVVLTTGNTPLPLASRYNGAPVVNMDDLEREAPPTVGSGPDDALLERYIKLKSLPKNREREAREMWRIFRAVVNKPLKECDREDGSKIVEYLVKEAASEGREAKRATLVRRMVPLVAVVNLAIEEGKHRGINPFSSVVPESPVGEDDEDERDAFTDDDVKTIKANLKKLDANDQLLLRIVATTGMRRGEAFRIASEQTDNDIRYCEVRSEKGAKLFRRIPFPKDLLDYLPTKITGPLLTGREDSATKRLTQFMTDIGVINDHDGRDIAPMHSFRHRAKNRLRDGVPDAELRDCIGGWRNKKNAGTKYGTKHGKGFSIKKLKAAIDKIGF